MSSTCYKCFKSKEACLCGKVIEIDTKVKFVILIHPQEAHQMRTGTGRMAHLSLKDSELLIGIDFTEHKRLNELLSSKEYYPVLLYPTIDSMSTTEEGLKEKLGDRRLLVILIDGTWHQAKKMLRLSKNLHALPKLRFTRGYSTRFVFKREPAPDFISTIESCYYLIKELSEAGIAEDENAENLMVLFDTMVAFQLEAEKTRKSVEGTGKQEPCRKKLSEIRKEALS